MKPGDELLRGLNDAFEKFSGWLATLDISKIKAGLETANENLEAMTQIPSIAGGAGWGFPVLGTSEDVVLLCRTIVYERATQSRLDELFESIFTKEDPQLTKTQAVISERPELSFMQPLLDQSFDNFRRQQFAAVAAILAGSIVPKVLEIAMTVENLPIAPFDKLSNREFVAYMFLGSLLRFGEWFKKNYEPEIGRLVIAQRIECLRLFNAVSMLAHFYKPD